MSKHKKQLFIYGSLILLTGCAHYSASTLSPLSQDIAMHSNQEQNVLVSWKFFDKDDCKTYLGRNVLSEGFVPVQITIRNNSNDPMYLSTDNFNIPLAPAHQVAQKVHTSTAGRVVAWGIGGLIVWPLLIPAVYDGIKSSEANQALDEDYLSKTFKEHTIQPHATFDRVIFFPKEKASQNIEMFLLNEKTKEKIRFSTSKAKEAKL